MFKRKKKNENQILKVKYKNRIIAFDIQHILDNYNSNKKGVYDVRDYLDITDIVEKIDKEIEEISKHP